MSSWKLRGIAAVAVGVLTDALAFPATVSAADIQDGYYISVAPTSQNPGQTVTLTGNGQYYTDPFSGDNCDSVDITATVTYYAASGQKTASTDMGTSDGDGNITGPVTIPADALPTSVSGHSAAVQAYCQNGENDVANQPANTYFSQVIAVTVLGSVPPTSTTTTTTTVPSTTTTIKTPCACPVATTTPTTAPATTTVPAAPAAPAAQPVAAQPKFTG